MHVLNYLLHGITILLLSLSSDDVNVYNSQKCRLDFYLPDRALFLLATNTRCRHFRQSFFVLFFLTKPPGSLELCHLRAIVRDVLTIVCLKKRVLCLQHGQTGTPASIRPVHTPAKVCAFFF